MKPFHYIFFVSSLFFVGCSQPEQLKTKTAQEILGNTNYKAISFGGFRTKTRKTCPSIEELKEDMRLLEALDIKLIRTYSTQLFPHAERTLKAIRALKKEDPTFEMYVMLGAWVECKGAWTEIRDHSKENIKSNTAEIEKAIELANEYEDIVKVIAVGNEAMVHWAETYFVDPAIVLKYVEKLQQLKNEGGLNNTLWITSSDNFASWGGGSKDYHNQILTKLIQEVDYISMHTYPFHDTHYNPDFWQIDSSQLTINSVSLAQMAVQRAGEYAISQYESTKKFVHKIDSTKPIHIGETGWATSAYQHYGDDGSGAAGEYQQKLYYNFMRRWSEEQKLSCFFFEAFDEPWKDALHENGSENHFGLITVDGKAKYVLWNEVDAGTFTGLKRGGLPITKTFEGREELVLAKVKAPAARKTNK